MRSRLAGRRMSLSLLHPQNVPCLISLRPAGRSTDLTPQFWKAYCSTEQPSGMVIDRSSLQFLKLPWPAYTSEFGSVTRCRHDLS